MTKRAYTRWQHHLSFSFQSQTGIHLCNWDYLLNFSKMELKLAKLFISFYKKIQTGIMIQKTYIDPNICSCRLALANWIMGSTSSSADEKRWVHVVQIRITILNHRKAVELTTCLSISTAEAASLLFKTVFSNSHVSNLVSGKNQPQK